jgi:twinkle protein
MSQTIKRTQCPECAEQGRDTSGNNLSWFHNQYGKLTAKCVAGCAYKPNREQSMYNAPVKQEVELINSGIYQDIPERKLSKEICELYSYQVGNYGNKQVHIENYYQEDVLVAQKIRTIKPKKFIWQGHAGSIGFYGEHLHRNQSTLWITEGAIDALSLVETMKDDTDWVQSNLVVSLKEGAGKGKTKNELKRRIDFLDMFDRIILAFDTDKAGLISFDESLKLFEPGKVWTIDYKFKDANEYLLNGAREQLEEDIRTITRYRPPSIRIPSLEGLLKPEPMGLQLPFPQLNDMIRGFKQGRIYTFAGGSGLGKSSVTKKITYELMKQDPALKVGVAYLEEPLETTGRSFIAMDNDTPLFKLEEEPDHISFEKFQESYHNLMSSERLFTVDASFMSLNGDDLLYTLEYLIKVEKCELVVLDHLTMITYDQIGEQSERKDIDILMKKLKVLAHNTKAKIVVVVHLKRPTNGLAWDHGREVFATDLRGSASLEQLSDAIIGLEANRFDNMAKSLTKLKVIKNRITGKLGYADTLVYLENTGQLKVMHD